jgi:hypothetical protein
MKQSYGFVETGGLGVRRLPSWSQAAVALILLAIAIAKAVALSGQQVEAALFPVPVLWMVTVLEFALGVAVVCCRGDWVLFVTAQAGTPTGRSSRGRWPVAARERCARAAGTRRNGAADRCVRAVAAGWTRSRAGGRPAPVGPGWSGTDA